MDLGISLPTSGPLTSPEAIMRIAQEAERLGYAAVWTYERLLYAIGDIPQPGGPPRPLPDVCGTASREQLTLPGRLTCPDRARPGQGRDAWR